MEFAHLVGVLTSVRTAPVHRWAHRKMFERQKDLALAQSHDNYNKRMAIPEELQPEFKWWLDNI